MSTEEYGYDSEGRADEVKLTLDARPSHPMTTNYVYDTLDRAKDVVYPAQYGMAGAPRKTIHHEFDAASRLSGLQVNGTAYASVAKIDLSLVRS